MTGSVRRFVIYISRFFTRTDSVVQVALDWGRALEGLGYEVALLHGTTDVIEGPPRFSGSVDYVPHAGIERNLVPIGLSRHLRPGDVLLLHADWRAANYVAAAAAWRRGVPYVVVPHGAYYPQQLAQVHTLGGVRRATERQMVRRALALHLFWPSEVDAVRPFTGATPCVVAPTGCEVAPDPWIGSADYYSWIGRYVIDHKGLDLLAEAVAILPPEERPSIELRGLDLQGDAARLKDLVDRLGIADTMSVGGLVLGEEKDRFLREAAAYLHPSRWECHSIALLENLSRGVPSLVTTGNHAAAELAAAGAAIVAAPDAAGLAEGLGRLRRADRSELGERALAFVRDRLSWERTAADFAGQVEGLLHS